MDEFWWFYFLILIPLCSASDKSLKKRKELDKKLRPIVYVTIGISIGIIVILWIVLLSAIL